MTEEGSISGVERTRLVDHLCEAVQELALSLMPTEMSAEAKSSEVADLVEGLSTSTAILSPVEAMRYFEECRQRWNENLKEQSRAFTPARWLWYLRRLPVAVFAGELDSTLFQDQRLAEILSQDGRDERTWASHASRFSYPVNEGIVRRVLRFCRSVVLRAHIDAMSRRAQKGISFKAEPGDLAVPISNPPVEEAIALYDERMIETGPHVGRAGVPIVDFELSDDAGESEPRFLGVASSNQWDWLPTLIGPLTGEHEEVEVYGRRMPRLMTLQRLRALPLQLQHVPDHELLTAVLLMMHVAADTLPQAKATLVNLTRYGYSLHPRDGYLQMLHRAWPHVRENIDAALPGAREHSTEDLVPRIVRHQGSDWPLRAGPLVRAEGNHLVVDLAAATWLVDQLLSQDPTVGGRVANERANAFELAVRDAINDTAWGPSNDVAEICGRTLRISGQDITDIDAVAEFGSTLLLIDCKSALYTDEYDQGQHNVVRNRADAMEAAAGSWRRNVEKLRANPVGDNYDVGGWTRIEGVVITPFPVYVPMGQAAQESLPGLRRVASLGELITFMHRESRETSD